MPANIRSLLAKDEDPCQWSAPHLLVDVTRTLLDVLTPHPALICLGTRSPVTRDTGVDGHEVVGLETEHLVSYLQHHEVI